MMISHMIFQIVKTGFVALLFVFTGVNFSWAQDFRDVKPPVVLPVNYFFLIAFLGFVLLAILFFVIKRILNKKKKKEEIVEMISAWEWAFRKLEELLKTDLLQKGVFKEFYMQLTDIVREYFENQFEIRAPEMTTEEFLISIKTSDKLSSEQKEKLKDFLSHCDMVKFAKYSPLIEEGKQSVDFARNLIETTKDDNIKITIS